MDARQGFIAAQPGGLDTRSLEVSPAESGLRVDRFLAERLQLGRRAAARLAAAALIDGRPAQKGVALQPGQRIELPTRCPSEIVLPDSDLLCESPTVLVLSKPRGLSTVAASRDPEGDCLARRIGLRFPEMAGLGHPGDCGLFQRLDQWTSGLLLAARTTPALETLRHALRRGKIGKSYLAVVEGRLERRMVVETPAFEMPLLDETPGPVSRKRRAAWAPRGARSTLLPVVRTGRWTLVQVLARTGVRHQVRVHLSSIGLPILGDTRYGGQSLAGMQDGFLLHAHALSWPDPESTELKTMRQLPPVLWWELLSDLPSAEALASLLQESEQEMDSD